MHDVSPPDSRIRLWHSSLLSLTTPTFEWWSTFLLPVTEASTDFWQRPLTAPARSVVTTRPVRDKDACYR